MQITSNKAFNSATFLGNISLTTFSPWTTQNKTIKTSYKNAGGISA